MESSSTGEFLLGVEEYLTQTGNLDQANQVHTLARAFMGDNPKESCSRAFLQDFSAAVSKQDQPLADLMHKTVTVTDQNQYHRAVLHYLATLDNFSVEQKNLMFKTLKAESVVDVLRSFIIFLINAYEVEISLKDFLFKSTKIQQPDDLCKDLLNYIACQSFVEKPLKDLIHKIIKSTDVVAVYLAVAKFAVEVNKDKFSQELIDLTYKIIKSNNENEIVRHLILFCNNTGNKELDDFIFKSFKSESNFENYKVLLRYAGVISNTDRNLSDLSLAISRALETANFDETFIKAYMAKLDRQYQSDKLFRGINSCLKNNMIHRSVINDAFSRSQLRSKFWLVEELSKIRTKFDNVAVLAGWFGQLKNIYSQKLSYKKMRIVDIDAVSCEASDLIFNLSNLEDHKVKSVRADINNLTLHANGYEWTVENFRELTSYTEKFLPDLIINTSAEHMTEEWFHQIRFKQLESNPIVVIQSNNLFDIPDHINCVHSTDHMLKKFPMKKVLYVGELQLKGYKRVMLIGRP